MNLLFPCYANDRKIWANVKQVYISIFNVGLLCLDQCFTEMVVIFAERWHLNKCHRILITCINTRLAPWYPASESHQCEKHVFSYGICSFFFFVFLLTPTPPPPPRYFFVTSKYAGLWTYEEFWSLKPCLVILKITLMTLNPEWFPLIIVHRTIYL